ncbi:tetratricopeptide repeat protein [Oricola nitratireducens]|uniref:tetratricopeptide repeat protein n=1 Tax=Oricola nitratireducens TaxID=2775868 RepID=UPI0018677BCD|nr:tetratricopeptide repeat protein [Oricola nitratireducens]
MEQSLPEGLARQFANAAAQGDWPEALAAVEALARVLPDNASVVYNKALVLRQLGRADERIACLDRALALEPGHANARFELASALMDGREFAPAAEQFSAYLASAPEDADALLNLGNCLVRLDRGAEAVTHLRKAHEIAPSQESVAALATALRDRGDLAACEVLLSALPETPESSALRLKILTQGARGRIALAVDQTRFAR